MRLAVFAFAACTAFGQALPEGDGKDLVQAVCTVCHEASNFTTKHMTKPQWEAKVTEMLQEDPDITQPERDRIAAYLARVFPAVRVNVNKASAKEIETGLELAAKEAEAIVQYRQQQGAFQNLDALKKVPGIDAVKIQSRKDRLDF